MVKKLWGPRYASGVVRANVADPLIGRIAARLEPALRAAFLNAVRGTVGQIDLAALTEAVQSGQIARIEAAALLDQVNISVRERMLPLLGRSYAAGVAVGQEVLGTDLLWGLSLKNPAAIGWVTAHAAELVTEVSESTRSGIRALIQAQFSDPNAMGPHALAREIREVIGLHSRQVTALEAFRQRLVEQEVEPERLERRVDRYADALLRGRAENIARTETITASAEGQEALWREAINHGFLDPDKTTRVWIVTDDDRLDHEICEPMDEQEVALGQPFTTGRGQQVKQPPAHPQCRCAVALRIK